MPQQILLETVPTSDLVFIAFPDEQKAGAVREKIFDLQHQYLIELGDAVIAVKPRVASSSTR